MSEQVAETSPTGQGEARRRRIWREIVYILAVYFVYSTVRNKFGSAGGEPAPSIERLTETGNDGRQAGGEEPAAVDGSGRGCGPDPGGVHDGRYPL